MTEPATDPRDVMMARRYGRRPRGSGRRPAIVALVVFAVALGAWALWAAIGQSRDAITAAVWSYHVVSPHEISVTVEIHRPSDQAVRCLVSAFASDHSDVGEVYVSVPVHGPSTSTVTTSVKTERAATGADVGRCRVLPSNRNG